MTGKYIVFLSLRLNQTPDTPRPQTYLFPTSMYFSTSYHSQIPQNTTIIPPDFPSFPPDIKLLSRHFICRLCGRSVTIFRRVCRHNVWVCIFAFPGLSGKMVTRGGACLPLGLGCRSRLRRQSHEPAARISFFLLSRREK